MSFCIASQRYTYIGDEKPAPLLLFALDRAARWTAVTSERRKTRVNAATGTQPDRQCRFNAPTRACL